MAIQNIKNNFTRGIECRILTDKYYDFMLYKGEIYTSGDLSGCLATDFSNLEPDEAGRLYSTVSWRDAVNSGVELEDIGFTGIDNGFITFRKDRISNREFLNILTNSTFSIMSGDTRFFLSPVSGNTQLFDYPMSLETDESGKKYISFKGGFYQGFFKLYGFDYQTLPSRIENDLYLYFRIRPRSDYETGENTINKLHPENAGTFFYVGTRAENKFWNYYGIDKELSEKFKNHDAVTDGYFTCSGETYNIDYNNVTRSEYLQEEAEMPSGKPIFNGYFADDGYILDEEIEDMIEVVEKECNCNYQDGRKLNFITIGDLYDYKYKEDSNCCKTPCDTTTVCPDDCNHYYDDNGNEIICPDGNKAIEDAYMMKDIEIDERNIYDSFGHSLLLNGYVEIESDNKFLMFDRTKDGFTVHNWVEGTKVTLTSMKGFETENYFLLMNRTKTGMTASDVENYKMAHKKPYAIYNDIKDNAFALKITENGAIGYRYGGTDCESEEEHYSVMEEYSLPGLIKYDQWNDVFVRFSILDGGGKCARGRRKMKIMIYVNGFLVFVSKEMKELNLRALNDVYQKQEGVPYSLSLGGGTQGLLESILPDYYNSPNYTLPIERDFCGSFLGDIQDFKIFDCLIDYDTIRNFVP